MERFYQDAESLFDSALRMASKGFGGSHWTILIGEDSRVVMKEGNSVPLESARLEERAQVAFRVVSSSGKVTLEACDASRHLLIAAPKPPPSDARRGQDLILYDRLDEIETLPGRRLPAPSELRR